MIPYVFHAISHKHEYFQKDDIGAFQMCGWRFVPWCRLWFRPAFDGAGWHLVPWRKGIVYDMLMAQTAHEAMALLRAELDKVP